MEPQNYRVEVGEQPPYATNDEGRLWAMLFGVLLGQGMEGWQAQERVNKILDSAVKTGETFDEELSDGRKLRVRVIRPEDVED